MVLSKEKFIVEYVKEIRGIDSGIGGEKLWWMYRKYFPEKYSMGRDCFLRVLRENGLLLRRRKRGCRTTDSRHDFPLYPNLIKDLLINHSNEVWVSDITYVKVKEDFCFLSLVTDAYDRQIIGYCVSETLEAQYAIEALEMAVEKRKDQDLKHLIHHSDRGIQYACQAYREKLSQYGFHPSMTENGDPKENAIAERVNGILKKEFLDNFRFDSLAELKETVKRSVEFYNTQRPHRSLEMRTPQEVNLSGAGPLKKRWLSLRDKYLQLASQ